MDFFTTLVIIGCAWIALSFLYYITVSKYVQAIFTFIVACLILTPLCLLVILHELLLKCRREFRKRIRHQKARSV